MKSRSRSLPPRKRTSLGRKVATPLLLGAVALALLMVYAVYTLQVQGVEDQAISQASGVNAQFVDTEAILAERGHLARHLVHQVSERLSERGLMRIRLISDTPANPAHLPGSAWEEEALAVLSGEELEAQTRLGAYDGETWLVYMTPVLASADPCVVCHNGVREGFQGGVSESCISCHQQNHGGSDVEAGSCIHCHDPHGVGVIRELAASAGGRWETEGAGDGLALGDMVGALVIEVPLTEALDTARDRAVLLSLGILGSLSLFVGFVIIFQRRLVVRPVGELVAAAEQLAQGDLDVSLAVRSTDEIGRIADSFRRLIAYVQEVARLAIGLSEGDLTVESRPQSDRDVLGNAFSRMTVNLRGLVRHVADAAGAVDAASGELHTEAQSSVSSTQEVAAAMHQVAAGTAQQSQGVIEASTTVTQVSQVVDSVAQGARAQAAAIEELARVTANIAGAAQRVSESARYLEGVKEMVDRSAEKVHEMGRQSDQIGAITATLDEIASQTSLLALNAAIEAARAKEHGRGFSVVASQVRELAQNAGRATHEIAVLIADVQQAVEDAVSTMEISTEEVDRQVNQMSGVIQHLDESSSELTNAMGAVSEVVEQNTAAAAQMSVGADSVAMAVASIASASEENSALAEEVSAAVEEVSRHAENINSSAQTLADMASNLFKDVERFRL